MAFYKQDGETSVLIAPNFVFGPYDSYVLNIENKDEHTYPVDGWYWFDTDQDASLFFNIEIIQ